MFRSSLLLLYNTLQHLPSQGSYFLFRTGDFCCSRSYSVTRRGPLYRYPKARASTPILVHTKRSFDHISRISPFMPHL
ncbi:hypothetical protein M405DRAFT_349016 [Rhizopogon salebrosus TDB-379]|nr:hypothetical protein M405DRAFT_349016 [Rhizopogon salebrosus TDB-379]